MNFIGENFSEAVSIVKEMSNRLEIELKKNFDSRPKLVGDRVTIWSLIGCAIKKGDNECTYTTRNEIPEDKEFIIAEINGNFPSTMILIPYIILDSENDTKLIDPITKNVVYTRLDLVKRIDNYNC